MEKDLKVEIRNLIKVGKYELRLRGVTIDDYLWNTLQISDVEAKELHKGTHSFTGVAKIGISTNGNGYTYNDYKIEGNASVINDDISIIAPIVITPQYSNI